jgi:hypothetical protein
MTLSTDNSLEANTRIGNLLMQKFQTQMDYQQFRHDYLDANHTLAGAEPAWDRYIKANPLLVTDKDGTSRKNPDYVPHQEWFRQNTDPQTGRLVEPGQKATGGMPPEGSVVKQGGKTYRIQNGAAVEIGGQ